LKVKEQIEYLVKHFIKEYSAKNETKTTWREPLIKYSDANDEMYIQLKKIVGPEHNLPQDYMKDAQTVISYFIPLGESVVHSNTDGKYSSREWAAAYIETNDLIFALNNYIKKELENLNYKATNIPATHNFDKKNLISNWSHRHVAYISGLGKFGLNNMLITDKGCCGRVGSIVTNIKTEPSKRIERELCLYKKSGACKKCVQRCVNGALKVDSFNRHRCYEILLYNDKLHADLDLTDVCGKCCVDLPCSLSNPVKTNNLTTTS